jgi:CRP-like cAMP-binding protein
MWRDSLIDAASFRAWMLMLGQTEADERMAHLFCEMFVRLRAIGLTKGRSFEFPVTQIELADALGISAVHANRTLQELRARGVIAVERFDVTIPDWEALQRLASFDPAYLHFADEDMGV